MIECKCGLDDFGLWMRNRFRQGTRHPLSPLAHVVLHPVAGVVVMTAEQALRLAAWLRECAGVEAHGPCGMAHHAHDCDCQGAGGSR